ncbi:type I 3-dehydroquinate dehydratase [Methanopyrus sp.]
MIIATLTGRTVEDMVELAVEAVEQGADALEVRLDYLENLDMSTALRAVRECTKYERVVATLRREEEGGLYKGDEERRLEILERVSSEADYVDLELDVAEEEVVSPSCDTIVSYHNFENTPPMEELIGIRDRCAELGDVAKVVTTARGHGDALRILEVVRTAEGPTIGFAMGEEAKYTRVVSVLIGGFATYAAVRKKAAPGQLTVEETRKLLELLG